MKKRFASSIISIIIALTGVVCLLIFAGDTQAAPSPVPVPEKHDNKALPRPSGQITIPVIGDFGVACGDASVSPNCRADCYWINAGSDYVYMRDDGGNVVALDPGTVYEILDRPYKFELWEELPGMMEAGESMVFLYGWPLTGGGGQTETVTTTTRILVPSLANANHRTSAPDCTPTLGDGSISWVGDSSCCVGSYTKWCHASVEGRVGSFGGTITEAPCAVIFQVTETSSDVRYRGTSNTPYAAWGSGTYDFTDGDWACRDNSGVTGETAYDEGQSCYGFTCADMESTYGPFTSVRESLDRGNYSCDSTACIWDMRWGSVDIGSSGSIDNLIWVGAKSVTTTEKISTACRVAQTIEFTRATASVGAKHRLSIDMNPKGLYPFEGGLLRWPYPPESVDLVYEFSPLCAQDQPGEGSGDPSNCWWERDYEFHDVAFKSITYTLPFTFGLCIVPTHTVEHCPEPEDWWDVPQWIAWQTCILESDTSYIAQYLDYVVCMIQQPFAAVGNTIYELVLNGVEALLAAIGDLGGFFVDFGSQLYAFLAWYIAVSTACYAAIASFFMLYAVETWPDFIVFVAMAVAETTPWIWTLLTWIATDFVTSTIGLLLEMLAVVINNASDLMLFFTEQFTASFAEATQLLGVVFQMFNFLVTLAADFITGLEAAIASTEKADMFTESGVYFWSGIDLFDDIASETPLVFLNVVSLGLIGVNLTLWTIAQLNEFFDDLHSI